MVDRRIKSRLTTIGSESTPVAPWRTQAPHFVHDTCEFTYEIRRLRSLAWGQREKFPEQEIGALSQSENGSGIMGRLRRGVLHEGAPRAAHICYFTTDWSVGSKKSSTRPKKSRTNHRSLKQIIEVRFLTQSY
jgi:hypothetical protein